MKRLFLTILALACLVDASPACPWCKRYGVKVTVAESDGDLGGLHFGQKPPEDKVRRYYVAAEPVTWTWAPSGKNLGKPIPLPPYLTEAPTAMKARFVRYTDASFSTRALEPPHQGILGPTLRGVVGEYLAVTFLNRMTEPLSMHPHGVRYDKDSEGAHYEPNPGKGSAVGAGARFTYVWKLDESSGPGPGEPSSKCWLYHSHCKNDEEVNAGLAGLIVVTDPKRARPDGSPSDVDREFAAVFQIFDETPEDEALESDTPPKGLEPRTFLENLELGELYARHAINGRMFGNLLGMEMVEGERVRWYIASLGEEDSLHTAHWHGARLREDGRRTVDVVGLLPGETKTADMIAENVGSWMFHCHVADHMMEGMFTNFTIHPKGTRLDAAPFLGTMADAATVRWNAAKLSAKDAPFAVTLSGSVSVSRGFYLPSAGKIVLRVGEKQATLTPTKAEAAGDGATLKAKNANEFGVVLAEEMSFELTLEGEAWRQAIGGREETEAELRIGEALHRTKLKVGAPE